MINRKELKKTAKSLIKPSYWKNVGAGLLLAIASGAGLAFATGHTVETNTNTATDLQNLLASADPMILLAAFGIVLSVVVVISMAASLVAGLLTLPLEVGCKGYFLRHREGVSDMKECLSGYTSDFGNVFVTMLIRDIKIVLWSMLFVVPGIVKSYEYKMVPYLLAENPDMDRRAVFALSKAMMKGHKMDAFKLDLSFLGWDILGSFTFGLTNIFYKNPYKAAADAEFYGTMCAMA